MREREFLAAGGGVHRHRERESLVMDPPRYFHQDDLGEHWENEHYYGTIRRFESGCALGGGPWAVLSISNKDQTARHDWRDFQALKTMIVGAEWEALELYPAESRVIDPANRFYLFCMPKGVLPFGLALITGRKIDEETRLIVDLEEAIAPQRPFPAAALVKGVTMR